MRFSLATAALATMAVGVVAAEEPVQTVVVTETATFCPKASTLPPAEQTTVTQVGSQYPILCISTYLVTDKQFSPPRRRPPTFTTAPLVP